MKRRNFFFLIFCCGQSFSWANFRMQFDPVEIAKIRQIREATRFWENFDNLATLQRLEFLLKFPAKTEEIQKKSMRIFFVHQFQNARNSRWFPEFLFEFCLGCRLDAPGWNSGKILKISWEKWPEFPDKKKAIWKFSCRGLAALIQFN